MMPWIYKNENIMVKKKKLKTKVVHSSSLEEDINLPELNLNIDLSKITSKKKNINIKIVNNKKKKHGKDRRQLF